MIWLEGRITWKMIHNLFDVKISYCFWLARWNIISDRIFGARSSLSAENGEISDRKSEWKGRSVIKNRVWELVSHTNDRKIHFRPNIRIRSRLLRNITVSRPADCFFDWTVFYVIFHFRKTRYAPWRYWKSQIENDSLWHFRP